MKNSKSVAWLGIFQFLEIFDVYTCLLVSKFQKFEGETRAEHFKKFSEGKLSRFNEYFFNFALKLKIFLRLFWKERCRTVERGKREGFEANKNDFKESSSN